MRPGISGGELNPAGEVPLYLRVQTVVNGIATGVVTGTVRGREGFDPGV